MARTGMTWTNERIERLKSLWGDGLSASQIASELGGVSRNAVIGKVHRLGLSGRQGVKLKFVAPEKTGRKLAARVSKAATQVRRPSRGSPAHAVAPSPAPETRVEERLETDNVIPMARYLTLQELGPHTCRWPIGDPQSPDFRFCGAPTSPGQVYCAPCSQKAYLPKGAHSKAPARMSQVSRWRQFR